MVDLADELLTQTGCGADAVVLVGGGATAAAIRERVADLGGLPVVVPEDPSCRRRRAPRCREQRAGPGGVVAATDSASTDRTPTRRASPRLSPRRVPPSGAQRGAAGVMLAPLAVIGFGLGYGRTLFGSAPDESAGKPVTRRRDDRECTAVGASVEPVPTPESLRWRRRSSRRRRQSAGCERRTPAEPVRANGSGSAGDRARRPHRAAEPAAAPARCVPPLESLPLPPIPQIRGSDARRSACVASAAASFGGLAALRGRASSAAIAVVSGTEEGERDAPTDERTISIATASPVSTSPIEPPAR